MTRILWQSYLDPAVHRSYVERLRAKLGDAAGPNVEFDVVGMVPPDRYIHRLTEVRCGLVTIRNAIGAERRGYDAVVVGHFQEPGLGEIRSALDIPVVGLGESSLLYACTLGQKIGLITIDPLFVPWHEEQVLKHGLERRVVGIAATQISPAAFVDAMEPGPRRDEVLRQFEEQARPLLDAGAEVLVPAGGLPAMALCNEPGLTIGGAPVLDIVAVAALHAQMAVTLRRLTGVAVSRRSSFARPSTEGLEEFLAETGGALEEPPR